MPKAEFKLDLVLLFDLRPSCRTALDLMHEHCENFLKAALGYEGREELEIKPENFRVKACGFAPYRNNRGNWLFDNPVVQETDQLQAQLSNLKGSTSCVEEDGSILEALLSVSSDTEIPARNLIAPSEGAYRQVLFFAGQQQEGFEAVASRRGMNPAMLMELLHKRRFNLTGTIPEISGFWEMLATLDRADIELGGINIWRSADSLVKNRPSRRGWILSRMRLKEEMRDPSKLEIPPL